LEQVYGIDTGTLLGSGGTQTDFGSANGDTIQSGGIEIVEAGGSASNAIVKGTQYVYGSAVADIVRSGGLVVVESGGSVSGLQVFSGGAVDVVSGGTVSDAVISCGSLEIAGGGAADTVTFVTSAGGTLQLDASQLFSGTIAGFGQPDYLDLTDIAFGGATTLGFSEAGNNLSGVLTVTDGTHTANLTLLGQYVTGQFTMASDGHGSTLIGDPPLDSAASTTIDSQLNQLTQAMATFAADNSGLASAIASSAETANNLTGMIAASSH
jgi:autotransporter passenger strand-loop-strand repeat protein